MSRKRFTLGPVLGYHGCARALAEAVLAGGEVLSSSDNVFDWLGPGAYFWVDSAERARDWAQDRHGDEASVLGAFIHPGHCLNLSDYGVIEELRVAYRMLEATWANTNAPMPVNSSLVNGIPMCRRLDCAVIDLVHEVRKDMGLEAYDSVYGVFEEGGPLFPGSALREKTHVQIAVRNPECILGYFRVRVEDRVASEQTTNE